MSVLGTVPTVGGDIGVWGQELNDALHALDLGKPDNNTVYNKAAADARFVRTVNGTGPDSNGNVVVSGGGGGGGTGTVVKVNNVSPDVSGNVTLSAASVGARPVGTTIPTTEITGLAGVATTGSYNDLLNKPGTAVLASQIGQANGVMGLDGNSKASILNMPAGFGGTMLEIKQNTDLTWPARTVKTTDRTTPVVWKGFLPGPTIGTATNTAVADLDILVVLGVS